MATMTAERTLVLEKVKSQSQPGTQYEIRLSKDGSHTYCTCPSWRFQRLPPRQRTCKHLKARALRMRRAA
jgi:hypothetical protein